MKINLRVAIDYVKNNLELFIVPVIFLFFVFGVKWVWHFFGLPTQPELIVIVQNFFITYGLWVIFISSIMEAMLFIGWYFPGSLVIFLGVASTSGDPVLAVKNVLVVCVGMMIGYSGNYILGKHGWYKVLIKFGFKDELVKIENRVKSKGLIKGAFIFYVYPGTSSLISTALGVLKFNYSTFFGFTLASVVFWNTIWGTLVYFFGMELFKILTNSIVFFIVFCVYSFYLYNKQKEKENAQHNETGQV